MSNGPLTTRRRLFLGSFVLLTFAAFVATGVALWAPNAAPWLATAVVALSAVTLLSTGCGLFIWIVIRMKSGERRWLRSCAKAIWSAKVNPWRTVGVVEEIDKRKQAEEALLQGNIELQSIYDGMADGVLIADAETKRFVRANASICAMLGRSKEELLSMSVMDVHPAEELPDVLETFQAQVEGRLRLSEDMPVLRKDGSVFRADISAQRTRYNGRPALVGFFRDVTERNRMANVLRASEEKYRTYIDNSPTGVFVADAKGRYVEVNRCAAQLTGYTQDELTWMSIPDILAPEDVPAALALFQHLLRTGCGISGEYCFIRKDGARFFMSVHAAPLSDDRVIGFCVDITDRKRVEAELRDAKRAADAASESKSEFLANMSHEIRTPMTAILGFADVLAETVVDKEAIEAIQIIKRNGDNLLQIINDILDLSKIESNKCKIEQIACSPRQVVTEVVSLMKVHANAKGLSLTLDIQRDVPDRITTDPIRLRQILMNLIGNAIKFTEIGGVQVLAQLDAGRDEPMLLFDVIDTGIGLSQEHIDRLFQPFSQADTSTTRRYGGSGLGLAISKRFAEMLGGDITVASVFQKGSAFRVSLRTGPLDGTLPLEQPSDAAQHTSYDLPSLIRIHGSVLLAEDGPDNQRLIGHILRRAGAEVAVAENGQVAFNLALAGQRAGKPFSIILMDMQMPVMDGYQAVRELRRAGYAGPIIALTAYAMLQDRQRCLDAGCNDYTTKPIDRAALLACIARHLLPEPLPVEIDVPQAN